MPRSLPIQTEETVHLQSVISVVHSYVVNDSGEKKGDMTQSVKDTGSSGSGLELSNASASSLTLTSTRVTWDSSSDCHGVPYAFHLMTGLVMAFFAVFCIFGNVLVLCTFARNVRLRTSSNLLIINLTIADFIMALVDFPMFTFSSLNGCWTLGFEGCQVYGLTSSISGLVAINTLAAISFDRYVVVVRRLGPFNRMAKSTIAFIIVVIWFLSILWSLLPFTGVSSYRLEGMGTSCTFNYVDQSFTNRVFFLGLVTFNFFIPLFIIVFSYSRIYISVCQIKREVQLFQRNPNTYHANYASRQQHRNSFSSVIRHQVVMRAEIKTAIVSIVIIALFCITWTPYVIIAFVGVFYNASIITPSVSMIPNIMAKISTATNAMLYSFSHPEVRKRIKVFLHTPMSDSSGRQNSNTAHSSPPVSYQECPLTNIRRHSSNASL